MPSKANFKVRHVISCRKSGLGAHGAYPGWLILLIMRNKNSLKRQLLRYHRIVFGLQFDILVDYDAYDELGKRKFET